jgi:hypothetical protein
MSYYAKYSFDTRYLIKYSASSYLYIDQKNNLRINWLKKKIKQEIKEFDKILEDYFIISLIQKQPTQN